MKMDDVKEGEPIFPAPPLYAKEIEFELNRHIALRAKGFSRSGTKGGISKLGGFGAGSDPQNFGQVQVDQPPKVWLPSQEEKDEKKAKGQWKQDVTFRSTFTLTQPPAWKTQTLEWHVRLPYLFLPRSLLLTNNTFIQYSIKLKVAFPGIGNNLKFEFPLSVISCMPPPGREAWDGPPPALDLPPCVTFSCRAPADTEPLNSAYFAEDGWHADDEKADADD